MAYHAFKDDEGNTYGSFEVFYNDRVDPDFTTDPYGDAEPAPVGWYWAAGFPGCLWDGEPNGPFATEQEAINDAQENA